MINILKKIKRKFHRNILVIKLSFAFQKINRHFTPQGGFHIDKIEKMIAAKIFFGVEFFYETWTYIGITTNYVREYFSKVYSIELSEELANEAKVYFQNIKNVSIIQGDSGLLLEGIIKENNMKKLFWLDAHYSAGATAKSANFGDTPISKEIEEILKYWINGCVILIDDARLFNGTNNYPTVADLSDFIKSKNLGLKMFIDRDIIHVF